MKHLFLCLVIFFCLMVGHAQPYVFYNNNTVIVRDLDSPNVHIDSFNANEKEKHPLHIRFVDHADWNFTVALKPVLKNEPAISDAAAKILFLSDIEGEFALFRQLLMANKVIDEKYNWLFGKNELVICGDLFDRGLYVTEELWLLYKLEEDASQSGGSVRIILGNHDIMNLSGDWRYVQPAYFNAAKMLGLDYGRLFDEHTELGAWLRTKNVIERTGRFLCTHGGVSGELLEKNLSIEELNTMLRPLYAKGNLKILPDSLKPFFNESALFWYRGYFIDPVAGQGLIDSTLAFYQADKIIVGHTIQAVVSVFYDGKVFGIDTDWHVGQAEGLLFDDKKFYRVNVHGYKVKL